MLRIAQMINPEEIPKSFRPRSSPFQHSRDNLLVRQSLLGMENGREASLEINDAFPAQIFGLFIRDALQCLFSLHHSDGVSEAFQIFRKTPLIRAAKEPLG